MILRIFFSQILPGTNIFYAESTDIVWQKALRE